MRTLRDFHFGLEWNRRFSIRCVCCRLDIDRQNGIRYLIGNLYYIRVIPNLQLCTIFRQRIGYATKSWFGLPEPELPGHICCSRLIVLAPIGSRGVAICRDPAAINENSFPIELERGQ